LVAIISFTATVNGMFACTVMSLNILAHVRPITVKISIHKVIIMYLSNTVQQKYKIYKGEIL